MIGCAKCGLACSNHDAAFHFHNINACCPCRCIPLLQFCRMCIVRTAFSRKKNMNNEDWEFVFNILDKRSGKLSAVNKTKICNILKNLEPQQLTCTSAPFPDFINCEK